MPLRRAFEKLLEMEYIYLVRGGDRSKHYYKLNMEEDNGLQGGIKLKLWSPKQRRNENNNKDIPVKDYSSKNTEPVNPGLPLKDQSRNNEKKAKLGQNIQTGSSKNETGSKRGDPVSEDDFFKKGILTPEEVAKDPFFDDILHRKENKPQTGSLGQQI